VSPRPPVQDIREPSAWGVQPRHSVWIAEFRGKYGRAPRILGIGNIANNGYRNAIALRNSGVECDVLCYNYFHIMGCPEWEAARFQTAELHDLRPIWSKVDLDGYERPRWFAQGAHNTAIDYLIAWREGLPDAEALWRKLEAEREDLPSETVSGSYEPAPSQEDIDASKFAMIEMYEQNRYARYDDLTYDDLADPNLFQFAERNRLRRLFGSYDLVIGYSTDGIFPLVVGKRPYIAYEHGTIRSIPFEPSTQGKLCNVTYRSADEVLITNCDNILAAQKLNLLRFSFVPHAILEEWRGGVQADVSRLRQIREQYATDFLIFHPARQHWSAQLDPNYDKGNDVLIRGFSQFLFFRPKAVLLMVDWGQHVGKSRALIDDLGISRSVVWIRPMPVREMCDYVAAADVLADQFVIGTFGGITPIGLMFEKPSLLYLNEDIHRWCFPDLPPILNARTPEEVLARLRNMLDEGAAKALGALAGAWYRRYHSLDVVTGRLLDACIHAFERHQSDQMNDLSGSVSKTARQSAKVHRLEAMAEASASGMSQLTQQIAEMDAGILALEARVVDLARRLAVLEFQYTRVRALVGPALPLARLLARMARATRSLASRYRGQTKKT
jgi:hypothetical protein